MAREVSSRIRWRFACLSQPSIGTEAENPERSARAPIRSYCWIIQAKETEMIQPRITPPAATLLPAVTETVSSAGAMIRAEAHRRGGPRGRGATAPIDLE